MRRIRVVVAFVDVRVRQIAATAARDQDLETQPRLVIQQHNVGCVCTKRNAAAVSVEDSAGRQRCQQPCRSSTYDQDIAVAIEALRRWIRERGRQRRVASSQEQSNR